MFDQNYSSILMSNVVPFMPRGAPKNVAPNYRMVNKGKSGEIWLYGMIGADWFGDGITAKKFKDDLKALGKVDTIDLRINSDGGIVTDARAMYTLLIQHGAHIVVHIDGIAASAASFIAMAGNEIEISEGGFVMIHESRGGMYGKAEDMRRMATVLDDVNTTITETYIARTKNSDSKIREWMRDETWFNGKDAVKNGFADRIIPNLAVAATIHEPSMFWKFDAIPADVLHPRRARARAMVADMQRSIAATG